MSQSCVWFSPRSILHISKSFLLRVRFRIHCGDVGDSDLTDITTFPLARRIQWSVSEVGQLRYVEESIGIDPFLDDDDEHGERWLTASVVAVGGRRGCRGVHRSRTVGLDRLQGLDEMLIML